MSSGYHQEALRRQRVINKRHFRTKEKERIRQELANQNKKELQEYERQKESEAQQRTYENEMRAIAAAKKRKAKKNDQPCPRGEYHRSQDARVRKAFMKSTKKDFSAKMQNRYNDTHYSQQW